MQLRKLASKAERLFLSFDGIQDLLATLNIHVSDEGKMTWDVDWYEVLAVKKQYTKLALSLHPDKNKSVGAEGAFKILTQALMSLLSDKASRAAYAQRRCSWGIYQKVMTSNPSKSVCRNDPLPSPANNGDPNDSNPSMAVAPPKCRTFWTVCNSFKVMFEYYIIYLDKLLECWCCKKPYWATEIRPPLGVGYTLSPQRNFSNRTASCRSTAGRMLTGHAEHTE